MNAIKNRQNKTKKTQTLPLFSDYSASTLSRRVSAMRVFRRPAEQKGRVLFEPFQCFLWFCVLGWGPRGQAMVTGTLSMVLTDHLKCVTESTARLESSAPGLAACCMTALCQSQSKFKSLTRSELFFPPMHGSIPLSSANTIL